MLCATILRHVAQTSDFFAEWRKLDWNRSMRMSPIFCQNPCFVQPFYGMWPKLKTLSQRGEKWNSIGVQYLAETYTLYNHFTVCSPNFRLFRRMAKTGLKSIYANESYILPEPVLCATFLRHVAQTTDSHARKAKYATKCLKYYTCRIIRPGIGGFSWGLWVLSCNDIRRATRRHCTKKENSQLL